MRINLEKLDLIVDLIMIQLIREELTPEQKKEQLKRLKRKEFINGLKKRKNQALKMSDDIALAAYHIIQR